MDYLHRRGRSIEVLFGFRRESTLALVPPGGLFLADVTLAPGDDGAVRCRVGGQPGAFVKVADGYWLNVTRLAALWPSLVSELVRRTDPATARARVTGPVLLESMDRLRDVILEHQIHAKDLLLLGEQPPAYAAVEGTLSFELRLPDGTLELAYDEDGYRAAHAKNANPFVLPKAAARVRWNGRPIALERVIGWDEGELAELVVAAHASLSSAPGLVLHLFETVLGDDVLESTHAADLRATLLNFWGVALRRAGRLDEAVQKLTRALPIAAQASPKLEQEVIYNRGYARLQTTMKTRVGPEGAQLGQFASHFAIDAGHRAVWLACLADFERALTLDPSDPSAISQVALTKKLLALLDAPEQPARPRAKSAPPPQSAGSPWLEGLAPLAIVVVIAIVVVVVIARGASESSSAHAPPPPSAAHVPSARDLSERARQAQLSGPDHSALLALVPTGTPCAFAVPAPTAVPAGEVVAPRLARGIGTGELYGTEYFDATIRNYLLHYAAYADALPLDTSVSPLHDVGVQPPSGWVPSDPYRLTILVTAWRDPIIAADGASMLPGEVRARLLVWSYADTRFVCATPELRSENRAGLAIVRAPYGALTDPEDDPLNRARVDLIEQTLRGGIAHLESVVDPAP